MRKITINPTASGKFQIGGLNFGDILRRSRQTKNWEKAAEMRFAVVQELLEEVGDDEAITIDWDDAATRQAMEIVYSSANDYLSIGEVETAVAIWESLCDMDEEDHFEAKIMLALCYAYIEDFDCLESVMFDISPKSAEYHLITLWATFRREGGIERDALRSLRTRHRAWYEEFVAEEHPIDDAFLEARSSERPSAGVEARELWLATESLWCNCPEFFEALRKAK